MKVVYVAKDSDEDSQSGEISTVNPGGDTPSTGDNVIIPIAIVLVMLVSALLTVLCFKSKKGRKLLLIILTISIVGSTSTLITVKANAAEDSKTIGIETSITVDSKSFKLNGIVKYNISSGKNENMSLSNFTSDEQYFVCGKESTITFTVDVSNPKDKVELIKNDDELVGYMHDDGLDGDVTANDGKYTYVVNDIINSDKTVLVDYYSKSSDIKSDSLTLYYIATVDIIASNNLVQEIDKKIVDIEEEFYRAKTDEEKTNAAIQVYNKILKYIDELEKEDKILYYIQENDTITIKFLASTYVYTFDLSENHKNAISQSNITNNTLSLLQTNISSINSILSVQPYANDLKSTVVDDSARLIANNLDGYSFSNNADNSTVSIDFLKHINTYKVIIWDGHGGYNSTLHSFIGSGESSNNIGTKYAEDMVGMIPPIIHLSGGNLGITSRFFTKYYNDSSFDNTIIYLGCCHGAEDDDLANALISCGVSTVFGYKNSVYAGYDEKMCASIFSTMIETDGDTNVTKSAISAFNKARQVNGETDPTKQNWWNKVAEFLGLAEHEEPAELRIIGDWDYRLKDYITISGDITDEDGIQLERVKVKIQDNKNQLNNSKQFDANYSFEVGSSENKTYTLTFEKEGYVTQTKTIIDVAEDRTLDVVMQKEVVNNPNIPEDAPTFNGHTYYLYTGYTWQEAEDYCESVGGHLVTITSQEEMDFIVNDLESKSEKANCYWVGLQRDGDSWKWITDEPFSYSNWAENEPNNYKDNGENVVHLFGKEYTDDKGTKRVGTWNDVTNEGAEYISDFYTLNNFGYICEWDSVNQKQNDPLAYSQYFALEPVVSNYGSETVDEYGVRLQVNDDAMIRKCAIYMYKDGSEWYRTVAFVGDNITSATYIPYVAYQGNVI